ncbi:hypothetical protein Ahia01_001238300 [Argonauta hians]
MRLPVKYNSTHPDEMTFSYTLGQGRDLTSTDLQKLKSRLHPSAEGHHNNSLGHGTLAVTFMDSRAVISATFVGLSEPLTTVRFVGPDLAGAPDLTVDVSNLTDHTLFVQSVDATRQVPYFNSVQFLKRVEVYSGSAQSGPSLVGDFEEGMMCVIRGPDMRVVGQGVFQFSRDGQWHGMLMVRALPSPVRSIQVYSDSSSNTGGVTALLHLNSFLQSQHDGSLFGVVNVTGQTSEFYLNLWLGKLFVAVETENMSNNDHSVYKGQISIPGEWYCSSKDFGFCPVFKMECVDPPPHHQFTVFAPHGLASFVLDRANVLYYSIHLEGFEPQETVTEIAILHHHYHKVSKLVTLSSTAKEVQSATRAFYIHGSLPILSSEMLEYLKLGVLQVKVSTSVLRHSGIVGYIPATHRTTCGKSQIITVGGSPGWSSVNSSSSSSSSSSSVSKLSIVQGDFLSFVYRATDNVVLLADKAHFERCDFSGGRPIGQRPSEGEGSVLHQFSHPGTYYIASQASCNATRPLKLTLTVIASTPLSGHQRREWCEESVYAQWRQSQLARYPGVDGVAASLGGVVMGMVILAAVLLWDRLLNAESAAAVNGFERF